MDQLPRASRRLVLGGGLATFLGAAAPARPGSAVPLSPRRDSGPKPLIMLDPGHGGRDPGAIGVAGTYEKHVAFAAAQELRRQLLLSGRYRVELTRGRDVFIPLTDRVGYAQRRGAALFMSVHADALTDHGVRGASVYTMSDTASDAQSAALAVRENGVDQLGGPRFQEQPPEVANILASLVRRETRAGSSRLQRAMVGSLGGDVPMLSNPGRHARFTVLRAADVPSVLVEMGFMSNPLDEAALRRADHRARVAGAMCRAVDAWFVSGPASRMVG